MSSSSDYREILAECIWKQPRYYGGFSPDGDYVIVTQNRDSDLLTRSNYRRIFDDLKACADQNERDHDEETQVYDFRAGHWACGWVEYVIVAHDAPEPVLIMAAEILCALSDYPVYDEDDYTELEYSEVCDYWQHMSVRERAEMIHKSRCGASIFSARRDYLPDDQNGHLFDYLRSD